MYVEITSRTNEKVKFVAQLATKASVRAQEGLFFAEGAKLCLDLATVFPAKTVFFTQRALEQYPRLQNLGEENYLVQEHVAEKLSTTKTTQGIFCVFHTPASDFENLRIDDGILLCESLQDPSNTGAVIRTAAALGFGGVVFCGQNADPFAPKALRASAGAAGRVPVVQCENTADACEMLHNAGVSIYATALQNAVNLVEVKPAKPFALMIGNEGAGLSAQAVSLADKCVYLPMMNGVESLNAAVAASVFMYHFKNFV